ncbi:MAG: dynamin family protein [Muribaculum sp.]|nr:dynamin family protein [Muribaculum sp.]
MTQNDKQDKNITRFASLISKIEPLYKAHHKDGDIETMKKMLQRASVNSVSVLICGEFKRGKSSFINAFLAEEVCPTDAGIATSVVSVIKYGPQKKVTRFYGDVKNLKSEEIAFEDIEKFAKGSNLEVDNTIMLIIELPSEKLKDGLVLMDTPGVGGLDPRHLFLTLYVMPKADVTFFVADAGEPLSSTELDFYKDKILQYAPSAKIILNKSDLKTKDELSQLIIDTKTKISSHCAISADDIDVIPVSSTHWSMFNKTKSEKMKSSSNCELIKSSLQEVVPSFKLEILKNLKSFMIGSLNSLIENLSFQLGQIEDPSEEAQQEYRDKLLELKAMKDDLANPTSATRKKISKVIHSTQSNVINELTRQSILFSTDCLEQLIKRPEAKASNGGEWVLAQLNLGLESIATEVDQRILLGFTEVNNILGENIEVESSSFSERISVDLTPVEKDMASRACGFARNALPGMGIATLTGMALSVFCGPVIIGLGALGAAVGYVYKTNKDQNVQSRIYELRSKLAPQITIVMNDLKAYVQQRFESFNESLVESFESMTTEVVNEMQEIMGNLKAIDDDKKTAAKLKEQVQEQLNFVTAYKKQVELLLTNPFEKK